MSMVVRYVAVLAILAIGDAIWLMTYFAPKVFRPTLGPILRDNIEWPAAITFYVVYALGIVVFSLSIRSPSNWTTALLFGALFGFFAYMTYDLTNYATLKVWTIQLAVTDVAWGTLISALAAVGGYFAGKAVE